jgi:ATP-dependent Clp protease ATP-binding subunit ClpA
VADWNTLSATIRSEAVDPRNETVGGAALLRWYLGGREQAELTPTQSSTYLLHLQNIVSGPMFSAALESTLHRAIAYAHQRKHKYATLEHLLLALIDDQDAADVMRACNVDIDKLRQNMVLYVEEELENLVTDGSEDPQPTAGFHRVIQRAAIHVQSSGREDVTAVDVLVTIFAEREAHAVYFLQEQEMTRYDAVNYLTRGIKKGGGDTAV